jgi:hypothetical protein
VSVERYPYHFDSLKYEQAFLYIFFSSSSSFFFRVVLDFLLPMTLFGNEDVDRMIGSEDPKGYLLLFDTSCFYNILF